MAVDLGQLKDLQAGKGLKFNYAGRAYHVEPTVEQGLAFQVAAHERDQRMMEAQETSTDENATKAERDKALLDVRNETSFGIYAIIAPLFGSKFHMPTKNKGPRFEGGIIPELLENGIDFGTLDRILTTMYLMMVNTEDVAAEFAKVGKLDVARKNVRDRENAKTETQ